MSADFAVLVAGAGPAGAAAALALARRGHRVLLIDKASADAFRVGEALPPAARPLLRDLGILERFLALGPLPSYGNVSSWGSETVEATDFLSNPYGHGWHLDRARFDALLRDAARERGAEVRLGVRLTAVTRDQGWRVTLRGKAGGQRDIHTDWLIDATGRRAVVSRLLGARRLQDDRLIASYARFRPGGASDRDCRTLIEAGPAGWWYASLVPSGERIVAFLTDRDLTDRGTILSEAGFLGRLRESRHVGRLLFSHGYRIVGRPRGADAASARLDRFGGPGWLAVGDAALSFDPLSSQGILTALYTGSKAGEAVHCSLAGGLALVGNYLNRLHRIDSAYRENRHAYYAAEGRWRDHPFWQRRTPSALSGSQGP